VFIFFATFFFTIIPNVDTLQYSALVLLLLCKFPWSWHFILVMLGPFIQLPSLCDLTRCLAFPSCIPDLLSWLHGGARLETCFSAVPRFKWASCLCFFLFSISEIWNRPLFTLLLLLPWITAIISELVSKLFLLFHWFSTVFPGRGSYNVNLILLVLNLKGITGVIKGRGEMRITTTSCILF
jgi:hypothetical protein